MTKDKRARRAARIAEGTWPTCNVDGCGKPKDTAGMCAMHRSRARRNGALDRARAYGVPWREQMSWLEDDMGCWIWQGKVSPQGYGVIYSQNVTIGAHRASYELANGPIPDGLYVCHTCDVRRCINPAHLWLGSHADNMRDMVEKGRGRGGPNAPGRSH